MAGAETKTLIGLHVDKTGGTSVNAHAVATLGDGEGYFVYGALANARRVMCGAPLLAEFPLERLDRTRLVFGHALELADAFLFPADRTLLFTIVRDPFERFVSKYKHYLRRDRRTHRNSSARAYFEQLRRDSFASVLFRTFGRFTEATEPDTASLSEILANLDFVLWTAELDSQGSELFALLGLPPMTERHRVYPETPDLDGITREEIAAANPLDSFIADVMRREGTGALGNPFGKERSGRERARARIVEAGGLTVDAAYERSFDFMSRVAMLPAARVSFERRGLAASMQRLERYLAERSIDLTGERSVDERTEIGQVLLELGDAREAAALLGETVQDAPDHFLAHYILARALKKFDKAGALVAAERAVALNQTNREAQHLLFKLTRSKKERRQAEAQRQADAASAG